MRAAVFLAMEEQDRLENKNPLINENLKKCLNSRDGRLVAGLIVDFLQVFNLDFSLAVFQPEINSLDSLDSRDLVCRDLGLSESQVNRNCPLLLELVRRGRHKPTEVRRVDCYNFPQGFVCLLITNSFLDYQIQTSRSPLLVSCLCPQDRTQSVGEHLDLDLEVEEDPEDGDSFFDDPLPKPQKTYGW
uniref:Centrosomal protein 43 n=1 Tax=Cyclopterus lumpus TaxID=8103 RepID=A0A8C2Z1L9_CYCLU